MTKKTKGNSGRVAEPDLAGANTYRAADARRNFFRIIQDVSSGSVKSPVLVRHKSLDQDVAIVKATEFQQTTQLLKSLLKARAGSFRLAGSMTVDGNVEDIVAEGRAEDAAASARRMRSL